MSKVIALKNGLVKIEDKFDRVTLLVSEGEIMDILSPDMEVIADEIYDCKGMFVVPGLIDLHIHGSGGGFSQNYTDCEYEKITRSQVRFGTTSVVLTLMGASDEELAESASLIHRINNSTFGANILGIHIEGPWISPKKIGYLSSDLFEFECNTEHAKKIIDSCDGLLKIVTLAPELEGISDIIHILVENNIVPSCGHTEANFDITTKGVCEGIKSFTHLWNMSGPVQSRDPGVVGCAMAQDECYIEIVADGYHVHPANVRNTIKAKPADKVCLVTDAMIATATEMKSFSFMGVDNIAVKDGRTCGPNNAIIGSVLTLNKAVKNVADWTNLPIEKIFSMASENQAKLLDLYPQKGVIRVGSDADIAVFDQDFSCKLTLVNGAIVHNDIT